MTTAIGSVTAGEGAAAGGASGGSGNPGGGDNGGSGANGGTGAGAGTGATGTAVGGAGGGSTSWRDALPEDIRGNTAIATFKDVEAVTRSYIHAQGVIGKKGAIPPADWSKATPQEHDAFFQAMGIPAADKYEVKPPEGVKIAQPFMDGFKQLAPKLGILPHKANELLGWFTKTEGDMQKQAQKDIVAQDTKNLDALKVEWGGDEGYNKNLQAVAFFAKEMGGDEALKLLSTNRAVGNNVPLLKLLHAASKLMGEDKLREGGLGNGTMSRTEIEAELNSIRMNGKENGFWDKNHPNHTTIVAKTETLAKMLTGGR